MPLFDPDYDTAFVVRAKKIAKAAFCFIFLVVLLFTLVWLYGFDFGLDDDGISIKWNDLGDHPTNWLDQAQHPEAR